MARDRVDFTLSDADQVSLWLGSKDGQRAVKNTLHAVRLPEAFDSDLVTMVCHGADQMVAKGVPIASVAAWATRTLRLRAIDLVRSPRTSRVALVAHTSDGELERDLPDRPDEALAEHDANALAVDVRQQLGATWASEPAWTISAALTVVAVLYDGAGPGHGCPQPKGGASEVEAAHWVGLWYAGRRDLFPAPYEPAGNTITKRRSRATQTVRDLLSGCAPETGDHNG